MRFFSFFFLFENLNWFINRIQFSATTQFVFTNVNFEMTERTKNWANLPFCRGFELNLVFWRQQRNLQLFRNDVNTFIGIMTHTGTHTHWLTRGEFENLNCSIRTQQSVIYYEKKGKKKTLKIRLLFPKHELCHLSCQLSTIFCKLCNRCEFERSFIDLLIFNKRKLCNFDKSEIFQRRARAISIYLIDQFISQAPMTFISVRFRHHSGQ